MLTGNVILIGKSAVGKTTVGRALATELGVEHVTASSWVRARATPGASRDELTSMSRDLLREQPTVCTDTLQAVHRLDRGGMVVEGFRNPFDFARAYRPERDLLAFLSLDGVGSANSFDDGVDTIIEMHRWASVQGIARCPAVHIKIDGGIGPTPCPRDAWDGVAVSVADSAAAVGWLWAWVYREIYSHVDVGAQTKSGTVHVDIPAFPIVVRDALLYDDPVRAGWTPGWAVAVSSYPGHALTFTVLTDLGAVFSYVPAHHIRTRAPAPGDEELSLDQLVYHNCPTPEISVVSHEVLSRLPVRVYERKTGTWRTGKYVATVDWYTDNRLAHIVKLDQGQVAVVPSHKVMFSKTDTVLPEYRKMRGQWVVTEETTK